jgi:hypothetical protein
MSEPRLTDKPSDIWLEAIWDFAAEKFPNLDSDFKRLITDVYSEFWKGNFAADGLLLAQDKVSSQPGPDEFGSLSRYDLALAALGESKVSELGREEACAYLSRWNLSDYRKIRDEYRYYFVREHEAAGHKRGLCANRMELEDFYRTRAQNLSSDNGAHQNKISKTVGDPKGAGIVDLVFGELAEIRPAMRFNNPSDKKIFDLVSNILTTEPASPLETTIRECANNLGLFPDAVEEQEKLVGRLKKRFGRLALRTN